jgi:DNA-directed RNA polymerase specialized sigma24 family protein
MFVRARSSDPEVARKAIAELCEHYHGPVYAYYRDKGADPDRASDRTQDLFVRLIADDTFARVGPEQGRFRTYLFRAAANQDRNAHRDATRQRRDPGAPILSLDTTDAEVGYAAPDPGLDPAQAYDRRWAHTVLDRVFDRIHEDLRTPKPGDTEADTQARATRWVWLEPLLREKAPQGHMAALAERHEINPSSLRAFVHRMRQQAELYIHEELADQVSVQDPEQAQQNITDEREHLRGAGLRVAGDV